MKAHHTFLFLALIFFISYCSTKPDPKQLLIGKWKVTALTLADNSMEPELLEDSYLVFSESGAFEEYVMGDEGSGTFSILPDGSGFTTTYTDAEHGVEQYVIEELAATRLVIRGEAHGMLRRLVLEKP